MFKCKIINAIYLGNTVTNIKQFNLFLGKYQLVLWRCNFVLKYWCCWCPGVIFSIHCALDKHCFYSYNSTVSFISLHAGCFKHKLYYCSYIASGCIFFFSRLFYYYTPPQSLLHLPKYNATIQLWATTM